MLLLEPSTSTELSLATANMLVVLRGTLPELNLRRLAVAINPTVLRLTVEQPTVNDFGWASIQWPGTTMVLVQGLTNLELTQKYANAWDEPINWNRGAGVNSFLWDFGFFLWQRLVATGYLPNNRIILVGHSAGGAAVQALARLLIEQEQLRNSSVITFGSPCAGPTTFTQSISTVDMCRWMNDQDPVPCIPPRQNQSPRVFAMLSNETATNWNRMVQAHGGLSLNELGGVAPLDNTNQNLIDVQTSIIGWLQTLALMQISQHSMPTYVTRLQTRLAQYGPGSAGARPTTHSATAPRLDRAEIERARMKELGRVELAYLEQQKPPLTIPTPYRFAHVRTGRVWNVTWMDSIVCVVPGKRKARDLARAGNTLLNRMQRCAGVSTQALEIALSEYLVSAADPTKGFSPTMQLN